MVLITYMYASSYYSTLLGQMEFSIKFYTVKSGLSIINIKGSQVIISETLLYLSEDQFCLNNGADPDEIWVFTVCQRTR